jgi:hypothetical protein
VGVLPLPEFLVLERLVLEDLDPGVVVRLLVRELRHRIQLPDLVLQWRMNKIPENNK